MKSSRNAQIERILHVITSLEANRFGMTLRELAAAAQVSERSARRYVQDVASRFFPIEQIDGEDGQKRWRFLASYFKGPTRLRLDEALALARVRQLVQREMSRLPLSGRLGDLVTRMEQAVPPAFRVRMDHLADRFGVAPGLWPPLLSQEVLDTFDEAARCSQTLCVWYRSLRSEHTQRRFDPYVVYVGGRSTYAHGFDHHTEERRTLALDRVSRVEPTGNRFVRPTDFSADELLQHMHRGFQGGAAVEVVLRARGVAARLLTERPEVGHRRVERVGDDEVRVIWHTLDTPALRGRLLSLGADVVVEAPTPLREAVQAMLSEALQRYTAP